MHYLVMWILQSQNVKPHCGRTFYMFIHFFHFLWILYFMSGQNVVLPLPSISSLPSSLLHSFFLTTGADVAHMVWKERWVCFIVLILVASINYEASWQLDPNRTDCTYYCPFSCFLPHLLPFFIPLFLHSSLPPGKQPDNN